MSQHVKYLSGWIGKEIKQFEAVRATKNFEFPPPPHSRAFLRDIEKAWIWKSDATVYN